MNLRVAPANVRPARPARRREEAAWWRSPVIYQIYPRSFADANGDGIGDLAGARSRLPYLVDLGVDAIWFTPWYRSPLADGGYDVADYRAIDPAFGTLDEAEALIAEAARLGIRTIVDIVPNHVSDQHPWFQAALAAGPGSPERGRFWFRPGRGANGGKPPTAWRSNFSGPAWTRTANSDGSPGEWYLHLFAPSQPDLNWEHPDVRREHEAVLRFWLDLGVAGFRIDSATALVKDPTLREVPPDPKPGQHPYADRDEVHDIYRSWRRVVDAYPGARVLFGEIGPECADNLPLYLRPDELHGVLNGDLLCRRWDAASLRESIDSTLAAHASGGAVATWVLANHDVTRAVTRYGRVDTSFSFAAKRRGTLTDVALGLLRARAAALLCAALPGAMFVYQGEELGLDEVEDLPVHRLQDPMHFQSGGVDPGRDGCRVPLPWSGTAEPFGFSPADATSRPWLPQPVRWAALSVEAQGADGHSTLNLYRAALRLRRTEPALGDGPLRWLPSPDDVLAFARSEELVCVTNLGESHLRLPSEAAVLLASAPTPGHDLPPDSTAWLRTTPDALNRWAAGPASALRSSAGSGKARRST